MDIKQFKLTNNDEIICEVLEWNSTDDIADVVISKALKIICIEDYHRGVKFFALRPWMAFQDDAESLQSLNSAHIVVACNPTKDVLRHYKACVKAIKNGLKKPKAQADLDEVNEATKDLTDEEMHMWLEEKYGSMAEAKYSDSDKNNVIKFKLRPKKTVH